MFFIFTFGDFLESCALKIKQIICRINDLCMIIIPFILFLIRGSDPKHLFTEWRKIN